MKLSINIKMIALLVLLVTIPGVTIGYLGYKSAEKAVYQGVADRLRDQASDWRLLVQAYNEEIVAQEARVKKSAENIVVAEAKMTFELIDKALQDNGGKLPADVKEDLLNRMNRNTVGQTGYIWVLDHKGTYILSKGRQRDGENIWEAKDSDGNYVAQDLINKALPLKKGEISIHSYPWINNGEAAPRQKIAATFYFPDLDWFVGISTYYDDLVDMNYRTRTIEKLKDLMAKQTVGKSGYIWVLNSKGDYVVSKGRTRDGENIWEAVDNNQQKFVQEMVRKAKAAKGSNDYQVYPWKNKGENFPRMKVSGFTYFEEWDWVIGLGAYYDDFQGQGALGSLKKELFWIFSISIILSILIVFFFANRITKPIKKMTEVANKVVAGDISSEIPVINSNDEVEELSTAMSMLVGAIKFLRSEKKK